MPGTVYTVKTYDPEVTHAETCDYGHVHDVATDTAEETGKVVRVFVEDYGTLHPVLFAYFHPNGDVEFPDA